MNKVVKQIGIVGAIVVVSSTVYLAWNGSIGSHDSMETGEVWLVGQRLVAERLEFPKNAFWGWRTDEEPVTELGKGHFVTAGWVRFERNSGEIVVLKFHCEIQQQSGEWKLIDLAMPDFQAF